MEEKTRSSQWSGGLTRARTAWAAAEVQMNLRCLFASSDVVHGAEGASWGLFSQSRSETELSRGSRESWPSVGEIWIMRSFFHGFFLYFALKFPRLPFKFLTICWVLPSKRCKCFTGGVSLLYLFLLFWAEAHKRSTASMQKLMSELKWLLT